MNTFFSTVARLFDPFFRRPLIPISIGCVFGVLAADFSTNLSTGLMSAAVVATALFSLTAFVLAQYGVRAIAFVSIVFAFFTGTFSLSVQRMGAEAGIPREIIGVDAQHHGAVYGEPVESNGRWRALVNVEKTVFGSNVFSSNFKTVLYWGGAGPALAPGDRIIFRCPAESPAHSRVPGSRDISRALEREGVAATCSARLPPVLVSRDPAGLSGWSFIRPVRGAVDSWLASSAETPGRPILRALVTGNMSGILSNVKDDFARSGTSHILSISGLHTTIVAQIFFLMICSAAALIPALALRVNVRRIAALISIAFVWFYTFFAGAQVPTVRAAIMTTTYLIAIVIGRDPDLLSSIAAAAIVILVAIPAELFDISFQLSFVSMIAIAVLLPALTPTFEDPLSVFRTFRPLTWLLSLILMSVVSIVLTAPLVARTFNQVSLIAPLANIPAVPLATFLIVPGGLIASVLYFVWPGAAAVLAGVCTYLCDLLWRIASLFSSLPHSYLYISTPTWLEIVFWWAAALSLAIPVRWRWRAAISGFLAILAVAAFLADREIKNPSGVMQAVFIDVGEGDSALLVTPRGRSILIDAGPSTETYDAGARIVGPYLYWRRNTEIDIAVVTHPHADHMGGMKTVVERFRPRELWTTRQVIDSPAASQLIAAARTAGTAIRPLDRESPQIVIDGVVFAIANPPSENLDLSDNDSSLAIKAMYLNKGFLLPGDLEKAGEATMIQSGVVLASDVLKVCHQGSATSTGGEFIKAVHPAYAVIPVGAKNRYGFPNSGVLERLENSGIRVYRTDLDGTITFTTNGFDLDIDCQARKCR